MLRNYLAAALRNLWRNRLYSALNIAGLALGFTAGLLIALYVHDEETYDRFWPHHEELYMVSMTLVIPGGAPWVIEALPAKAFALARPRLPAGVVVARALSEQHAVRRGEQEANESIRWVDADFFRVLRPVLMAGDLDGALTRPDGLVLTRHIARKYFGDASPLGQTLTVDRQHVLTVRAEVRDLPASSFLKADLFGSGGASFTGLGAQDIQIRDGKGLEGASEVYLRAPSQLAARQAGRALQAGADELEKMMKLKPGALTIQLQPVTAIHLSPAATGASNPRGDPALLTALALIGAGVVAMAAINFINLMTARASRRATEVGVRKAQGATPRDLMVQFIGESVLYCLVAMVIAVAAVELLLPALNALLQRDITLSYGSDLAFCAAVALAIAVAAGAYPALVLARFHPAAVLRGVVQPRASGRLRQVLVLLQFAVLIGLTLATVVVHRQVQFALNEGLRFDKEQLLAIFAPCKGAFPDEVRRLPGVRAAACSNWLPLGSNFMTSTATAPDGTTLAVRNTAIAPGLLELLGVHPLAGRFFSAEHPQEALIRDGKNVPSGPIVINETAVRKLHFRSPQAAIGQILRYPAGARTARTDASQIIGVAPDIPEGSLRRPVVATVFRGGAGDLQMMAVKLAGRQVPETLAAIDALWKRVGEPRPISRVFAGQAMQEFYEGETRQGRMFAAFAAVALFIACLGLLGLAAFTAERRTKEIGVRKALGASRAEIVRMLLWDLTRPVLLANLIAWPVGLYVMSRWLAGFAQHIELSGWMFLVSGLLAAFSAWVTVSAQALLVACTRPATALRHE